MRPWVVCETAVRNADVNSRVQEQSTSDVSESNNAENLNQHVSHDEGALTAMAAASHKQQKASVNKGRKRKRGVADLEDREEESESTTGPKNYGSNA